HKQDARGQEGFREVGGTGLEPVPPSLSKRGRHSPPFAPVRFIPGNRSFAVKASRRFGVSEQLGATIATTDFAPFVRIQARPRRYWRGGEKGAPPPPPARGASDPRGRRRGGSADVGGRCAGSRPTRAPGRRRGRA